MAVIISSPRLQENSPQRWWRGERPPHSGAPFALQPVELVAVVAAVSRKASPETQMTPCALRLFARLVK